MARRATRPGSAVLDEVRRGIAAGWPPGLTVLAGDDAYHLEQAQRALLAALVPPDASDFALTLYGDTRVDVGTLLAAARSVGMFAPRRVVLLRDLAMLDGEPEGLVDFATKPPPGSYLIVRATTLDRRRKLHQALAKHARLAEFDQAAALRGNPAADVTRMAESLELRIDRPAATFLVQVCGGDFHRLHHELEKIRDWIGGTGTAQRVTLEIVREVGAGSELLSGWELADAVMLRDRPRALAAARRLVQSGDEPLRVLGGLAWRARMMLRARALVAQGAAPARARRTVGYWGDDRAFDAALGRYELHELLAFPAHLLAADRTMKSRTIAPSAVLEALVDRLTAAAPGTGAR